MRKKNSLSRQFEVDELREMSARIGRNPLLVQASSGNTSVKVDDVLWIKASGKWLIDAEADDFLVAVKLARARRCLRENTPIPETETTSLRGSSASIETAMHAVLPYKVVVHVHSLNTIAWAVREDGPRQLGARLSGLPWQWIPYTPSGTFLASKIQDALSHRPQTSIFVLANHGLVVCGNGCRSAEQLLAEVEERLSVTPRPAPEPRYSLLQQGLSGSAWSLPACTGVHALATDHICRRILSGGILYPCQAIFLPAILNVLASSRRLQESYCGEQALLVEDYGVLVSKNMTRAEEETLVGLANVLQRIDASAPVRYLTASELLHAVSREGEYYRRSADSNCHSQVR